MKCIKEVSVNEIEPFGLIRQRKYSEGIKCY